MKKILMIMGCILLFLHSTESPAFQAESTHAGITEAAAQVGGIHDWLKRNFKLDRGLLDTLELVPQEMTRVRRWFFAQDVFRLNPAEGYAPSRDLRNRAIGWLAAGSVLEAIPSSRIRNHFLNPSNGKGLRQADRGLSMKVRVWDFLYGGGSLAGLVTGANFDLTGKSALRWGVSRNNYYNLHEHMRHRYLAQTSADEKIRHHHLAMALVTMGALAHLLQKMACPSYVRNDYVVSHLEQGSVLGGTPFARYVAWRYGRSGIPASRNDSVRFDRFEDFFMNNKNTGLAQTTALNYLSPGTLPAIEGDDNTARNSFSDRAKKLLTNKDVMRSIPRNLFEVLGPGETAYYTRKSTSEEYGPIRLFAYGKSPGGKDRVWLDRRVYEDYAGELIPRAVEYTRGFFDYLIRGKLLLRNNGEHLEALNNGVALGSGRIEFFAQAKNGRRRLVHRETVQNKTGNEEPVASVSSQKLPRGTVKVAVVFKGQDHRGELVVSEGLWEKKL